MRDIIIGNDNAAVELKTIIVNYLEKQGIKVQDLGCSSPEDNTYYPLIAEQVCQEIIDSGYKKRGILICGTGVGMAIAANKCRGIRAAVCHDIFSTERSILSNNGNVMCMGARVIGPELAKKLVTTWISLEFQDGASTPKVEAIQTLEKRNMKE